MQIDKDEIFQRLNVLSLALMHDSEFKAARQGYIFTPGERICINQERGSLYSQLSQDEEAGIRYYDVSDLIEEKINYTKKMKL
ncbi:MAG: hypothetical protein C0525_01510 [Flavobacterium sp.]|nr:hypothetical protein [Flavobacterium sp.]